MRPRTISAGSAKHVSAHITTKKRVVLDARILVSVRPRGLISGNLHQYRPNATTGLDRLATLRENWEGDLGSCARCLADPPLDFLDQGALIHGFGDIASGA